MNKQWHVGLLIAAGILAIYLLHRGIPQKFFAATGDGEPSSAPNPPGGLANATVQNEVPGANQTYNLPNTPDAQPAGSSAEYLAPGQVELVLAPAAQSSLQNTFSVGADYAEFIPAPNSLQG